MADRPLTFTRAQVARVFLSQPDADHWGTQLYQDAGSSSGTVYPMLELMKSWGWVTDRWETQEQADQREYRSKPRRYWRVKRDHLPEIAEYVRDWDHKQKRSRVTQ